MITFKHKGDFSKTSNFLKKASNVRKFQIDDLHKFGVEGVLALSKATPVRTGKTADSWTYRIVEKENSVSIEWLNSNVVKGVPIAVILQYGHGTGTGGYVQGIDYINPAIQPIFDRIAKNAWKEVTNE